ncbi:MAG: energy transducer TonB [Cyclobacteriaceae bacterium]
MLATVQNPNKEATVLICKPLDKVSESALSKSTKKRLITDLIALKEKRAESDRNLSRLFFAIGLTISLLLVIMAFEWKTYNNDDILDLGTMANDFEELVEIPLTEQPPPPPPQRVVAPIIKEVSDAEIVEEIEMEIDLEITEDMEMTEIVDYDFSSDTPEEVVEEIFDIVETQALPHGGLAAFYKYVGENLKYPDRAARLNVSGRVFVQFVVEKDGSLTDVKVIKGIFDDCDQEAIRVIENAPKWSPGKQRGVPVRSYRRVPIVFVLKER